MKRTTIRTALIAAGFFAACGGFEELVNGRGLDHFSLAGTPQELANSPAGREWVEQRASTMGFLRGFVRVASSIIEAGMARYWKVCGDVEALIVSGMGLLLGVNIAQRLGVPLIRSQLSPFAHTRYDWAGHKNLGTIVRGDFTAFLHAAFRCMLWSKLRGTVNGARKHTLALPPLPLWDPFRALERERVPELYGFSPTVIPRPPDWPDSIHVTGFWFLDDSPGWAPPPELVSFLDSGPTPVFVGFGSTPFPDGAATTTLVVGALERAGQRGIILAGGSGLGKGRLSDGVISLDAVPHQWLFKRVKTAVHHGGAGVTGAALAAGLPSVVVPVFADQPFWGSRVFALGAGPRPIPAGKLTQDALTARIQATLNEEMQQRASAIGQQIRSEDGVGSAVEVILRRMEEPQRKLAMTAT